MSKLLLSEVLDAHIDRLVAIGVSNLSVLHIDDRGDPWNAASSKRL